MQKTVLLWAGLLALTSLAALTPKSFASQISSGAPTPTAAPQLINSTDQPAPGATTAVAAPETNTPTPAQNVPAAAPVEPIVTSPLTNPAQPVRLAIPAIGLSDSVVPVGLTAQGDMAVPSGSTSNVGWYKDGIIPGQPGSAVFDAHVFAAFAKLNQVKVGDSIYVTDASGSVRRFVVQKVATYALADITGGMLFAPTNARDLNLITCAGELTPDHSTYDHRLVIYTTLAS